MIKVFMEGRIASDAKVFEYGSGSKIRTGVSFGLICNRFYDDEDPTYIQCTIWNRDENLAKHLTTGKQIIAVGDLTRNDKGYYSVSIDQFSFGSSPNRRNNEMPRNQNISQYDPYPPVEQGRREEHPFYSPQRMPYPTDDNIPF